MTNFGSSFKKAREHRGLSYAQIAEETRISARFLEAIENEDFQLLPGGIFNRGFIRTYASRVGLDPEVAIKEYEQLINIQPPESSIGTNAQAPAFVELAHRTGGASCAPPVLVSLVMSFVRSGDERRRASQEPRKRGEHAEARL